MWAGVSGRFGVDVEGDANVSGADGRFRSEDCPASVLIF